MLVKNSKENKILSQFIYQTTLAIFYLFSYNVFNSNSNEKQLFSIVSFYYQPNLKEGDKVNSFD